MHIERTDISSTEVKLVIKAGEEELIPIKNSVVIRLGKDAKLPGFREGKAPVALIEKNLDQSLLQGDFLDEAMTQLYAHATRRENLRPVTRPQVTVKKFVPFTELEYEIVAGVIGKIKLPDYKKLKTSAKTVSVTADDVTDVIETLRLRMAEKTDVKRAAKDGDEAVIDFRGVDSKKQPIAGAEGSDYPLLLGSNSFIPGFEKNLEGIKPGEEKEFDITFPKDYAAKELAGKKAVFTVKLKKLSELKKPKLDKDFVSKVGPFKNIEELKADINKQLELERQRDSREARQNEMLAKLVEITEVEIPQALIDQQVVYNIDEVRRNLTYKGQTYQEFLKSEGKSEEEYKKEMEPQAIRQLKASLILSEIAEKENLSVQPEELDLRIAMLKSQYNDPQMQTELDKPENRNDIASRLLSEKVIEFLISESDK